MAVMIITRSEPGASAFAAEAQARGFRAVLAPTSVIAAIPVSVNLSAIGALAFTSAAGVRSFGAPNEARALPVFAVGAETGRAAQAHGYSRVAVAGGDVANLAALIERSAATEAWRGDIVHVCGRDQAGDLVSALSASGVPARRLIAYQAEPATALSPVARAAIAEAAHGDCAAFFSALGVRRFIWLAERHRLLAALARMRAICISANVAQRVRAAGLFHEVVGAASANGRAMLDAALSRS